MIETDATIVRGVNYIVTFTHADGTVKRVELTRDEWIEMRRLQNGLFFTEPA